MNFFKKLQRFMYGRSGLDALSIFLFQVYIVLIIINIFIDNKIILFISLVLASIALFRILSKNIYQRSSENSKFLKLKKKVLKPFNNIKRNIKDKDHVYKKCHFCKTTLKLPLPSKRGIKKVKCTKCHKRNKFLILKKVKVELIRTKKNNKKGKD